MNIQTAMKTFRLPILLGGMALVGTLLSSCGGHAAQSAPANALIGSWTLVSPSDSATCPDSVQFTADTYTTIWKGVTNSNHAIYRTYPTYVTVYAGGPTSGYLQFNLTSADIITNVTGNQYAIANCPYKRT